MCGTFCPQGQVKSDLVQGDSMNHPTSPKTNGWKYLPLGHFLVPIGGSVEEVCCFRSWYVGKVSNLGLPVLGKSY